MHGRRNATEFLKDSRYTDRGVCRHKARVLAAILKACGIHAVIQTGTKSGTPYLWHCWVYIPVLDKVADPTTGEIVNAATYQSEYALVYDGIPLPSGWY